VPHCQIWRIYLKPRLGYWQFEDFEYDSFDLDVDLWKVNNREIWNRRWTQMLKETMMIMFSLHHKASGLMLTSHWWACVTCRRSSQLGKVVGSTKVWGSSSCRSHNLVEQVASLSLLASDLAGPAAETHVWTAPNNNTYNYYNLAAETRVNGS